MGKEVVVYINRILLSRKKEEILPFVMIWMNLEALCYLKEVRQRKTNTV